MSKIVCPIYVTLFHVFTAQSISHYDPYSPKDTSTTRRGPGDQTANLLISWLFGCTSWATFLYERCLLLQKSVFGGKMLTYLVVGGHGSNPNWSRWMVHPESGSYKGFFHLKGCFSSWLKCWLMGKLLGFSLWHLFLVQSRLLGEVTML